MSHTEQITQEITDFINNKVKDLDNYSFRKVMQDVEDDISSQLQALDSDEAQDSEEISDSE